MHGRRPNITHPHARWTISFRSTLQRVLQITALRWSISMIQGGPYGQLRVHLFSCVPDLRSTIESDCRSCHLETLTRSDRPIYVVFLAPTVSSRTCRLTKSTSSSLLASNSVTSEGISPIRRPPGSVLIAVLPRRHLVLSRLG